MKIVIAPDKFKDALDAEGVADALASGVRDAWLEAEVRCFPMADGGEGSGAILAKALGAQERIARVTDAVGRPIDARWWHVPKRGRAIVEFAEACGLARLAPSERDPLKTSSFGVGQLVAAAQAASCAHVTLCVGGSATVDGGAGLLQALGVRLLDRAGEEIRARVTGASLGEVAGIAPFEPFTWPTIELLVDVDNPLLGDRGAARIFGPQKGATPTAVEILEANLAGWASVLSAWSGRDVRGLCGGGAAGGVPAGLHGVFGMEPVAGANAIAGEIGLIEAIRECDLVLTGEGRVDEQTVGGKVVAAVARMGAVSNAHADASGRRHGPQHRARLGKRGVPVVAFCGAVGGDADQIRNAVGLNELICITPDGTLTDEARRQTGANLRRAARDWSATKRKFGL